jgi:hypothetical protein
MTPEVVDSQRKSAAASLAALQRHPFQAHNAGHAGSEAAARGCCVIARAMTLSRIRLNGRKKARGPFGSGRIQFKKSWRRQEHYSESLLISPLYFSYD